MEYTFCNGGGGGRGGGSEGLAPKRRIVISASVYTSVDLSSRQPVFKV